MSTGSGWLSSIVRSIEGFSIVVFEIVDIESFLFCSLCHEKLGPLGGRDSILDDLVWAYLAKKVRGN